MKPKFVEVTDETINSRYRKLMCVNCGATTVEKIGVYDTSCWACEMRAKIQEERERFNNART